MIERRDNCLTEVIGGLECHSPPIPPLHEIEGSHLPVGEQVWRRRPLPRFKDVEIDVFSGSEKEEFSWDEARREEFLKQTGMDPWSFDARGEMKRFPGVEVDPNYVSEPIADYVERELDRCDPWNGGHWIMVEGSPVWLTPFYYFYLQWWRMDSGYPEYRVTDRRKFWFWQYCWEDPMCMGMVESDKRGGGKSSRAGSVTYLATIYQRDCVSPIQSKTEVDAKSFFTEKISEPHKYLPDFLVPINDNETNPQGGLFFFAPSRGGKRKNLYKNTSEEALSSKIIFKSASPKAFDGATVRGVFVRDEEGKTDEISIWERHGITKECVYRDGMIIGKIYSTTTVAQFNKGGEDYKKLWDASNVNERDALGFTKSGLYRLFMPAYDTEFFDKYGNSVPDMPSMEQREYLVKRYKGSQAAFGAKFRQETTRMSLEDDPQALTLEKLKNPWTETEMFQQEGINCQYNIRILRQQEALVNEDGFKGIRRGDFVLSNGWGSKVVWRDDPEGAWDVSYLFEREEDSNRYEKRHRMRPSLFKGKGDIISDFSYVPQNTNAFCGGFDPTKASGGADKKKVRSHAAGTIFRKYNIFDPDRSGTWVADFLLLPDDWEDAWERFIVGCLYYGCQFLPEQSNAKPSLLIESLGANPFLMHRPETTIPNARAYQKPVEGLPASTKINEAMLQKKKSHIKTDGYKLIHPRIIRDSISFTPETRTAHDMEVASQLSLIATEKIIVSDVVDTAVEVGGLFNYG